MCPSFRDAGYDVTDFYSVDPRYGSNEDCKELCDKAHKMGLKVILSQNAEIKEGQIVMDGVSLIIAEILL